MLSLIDLLLVAIFSFSVSILFVCLLFFLYFFFVFFLLPHEMCLRRNMYSMNHNLNYTKLNEGIIEREHTHIIQMLKMKAISPSRAVTDDFPTWIFFSFPIFFLFYFFAFLLHSSSLRSFHPYRWCSRTM